jgi:hypothetical protein
MLSLSLCSNYDRRIGGLQAKGLALLLYNSTEYAFMFWYLTVDI